MKIFRRRGPSSSSSLSSSSSSSTWSTKIWEWDLEKGRPGFDEPKAMKCNCDQNQSRLRWLTNQTTRWNLMRASKMSLAQPEPVAQTQSEEIPRRDCSLESKQRSQEGDDIEIEKSQLRHQQKSIKQLIKGKPQSNAQDSSQIQFPKIERTKDHRYESSRHLLNRQWKLQTRVTANANVNRNDNEVEDDDDDDDDNDNREVDDKKKKRKSWKTYFFIVMLVICLGVGSYYILDSRAEDSRNAHEALWEESPSGYQVLQQSLAVFDTRLIETYKVKEKMLKKIEKKLLVVKKLLAEKRKGSG